tara:strand:- start:87 stop:290 length:204 start_codon:yes stop_codon:yes gene_type:complete
MKTHAEKIHDKSMAYANLNTEIDKSDPLPELFFPTSSLSIIFTANFSPVFLHVPKRTSEKVPLRKKD